MEILIFYFLIVGLVGFVDALFVKFKIWHKLESKSVNVNSRFLYELMNCQFCIKFHVSWVLTLLWWLVLSELPILFFVPFSVSGIIHLIQKK